MLLHASHAAAAGYKAVIITSEDTDVFVLSLAFRGFIPCSVFVKCGQDSNNTHRCVKCCADVGPRTMKISPRSPCLQWLRKSQCFLWKEVLALKMARQSESFQTLFQEIGTEWNITLS